MYGQRAYSPWWKRLRILLSVLAALSFVAFFILAFLKFDGHTAVRQLSWKLICAPALSCCAAFLIGYMLIRYYTRHAAFTYTSDAAASYLLGVRVEDLDGFHQLWVFRDCLLVMAMLLLVGIGAAVSLSTCNSCNTPYSLLTIGSAVLYSIRAAHLVWMQREGWRRLRLMVAEVARFQEFLDQQRLFNQVLPDLVAQHRSLHTWLSCFLALAVALLAGLGSVWISGRNCVLSCAATYVGSKYLLYGMYCVEALYATSELYLHYRQRLSGVESLEGLVERLDTENRQEKRRHMTLLRKEKQKRQNDSTLSR